MKPLCDVLDGDVDPASVRSHIGVEDLGAVCVITLARPQQHNVLSLASWRRLAEVFDSLTDASQLRAVVVRGAGGKAFCAGADIAEFPEVRLTAADAISYNEGIAAALRAVASIPVPVVAALTGLVIGGGCELAAACDVRIASTSARFGIPIGRLGVTLGYTEANAVSRLIGPAALKYLLFSGALIDVDEAARLGLVQQVVEPDQLSAATSQLIDTVLASSEVTIRAGKLVADMCGRALTAADTEALIRLTSEAYDGADLKEGVAAFLSRRNPQFAFPGRNLHGPA